ncbi:hypothetical protein [Mycoplasma suis]|uniref:Uncharacterized protein n=1 Tax=Mycoplasma suis (strain Illinois) TaxID=768700 RepID=F0QS03_MYCSL|nr:hypothetical protein [Mycoplasma suis]ADX98273.1 hypothetical protein MSU_0748 [Mycoplasma suis str. Illinois]
MRGLSLLSKVFSGLLVIGASGGGAGFGMGSLFNKEVKENSVEVENDSHSLQPPKQQDSVSEKNLTGNYQQREEGTEHTNTRKDWDLDSSLGKEKVRTEQERNKELFGDEEIIVEENEIGNTGFVCRKEKTKSGKVISQSCFMKG